MHLDPLPNESPLRQFKLSRIWLPVLFSLGVGGFMLYKIYQDLDMHALRQLSMQGSSRWLLLLGLLGMALRDAGYIWRTKLLSGDELSWRSAFDVTMLWEFANTLAPSLTGGTPLIIYMLIKEKVNAGKSTAIVFLTILLDQFFFVLLVPIMLLILGSEAMFRGLVDTVGQGVYVTFWIAYGILAGYGSLLILGIFVRPQAVRRLIILFFRLPFFRRWESVGEAVGNDLLAASETYRNKSWGYWAKLIVANTAAWLSRFLVLNLLFIVFSPTGLGFFGHLLLIGRQSILFVLMWMAITPGGSGLAEFSFVEVLGDMCPVPPGCSLLALLWRGLGFYPYMLLGAWLVPRWVGRVFGKANSQT